MSIPRLMLQTPIAPPPQASRDKALDREDGSQLLALEGKLDALVNLVTQLAANQKPASVARVCGIRFSNDQHTSVCPSSQQLGVDEHPEACAANNYSRPPQQQRQDTSVETRKLEGKLEALVNLVTQLATNQKPASFARVCGIRSSNDHHTRVHDEATDTSVETRKLEGKLDALVNMVTQLRFRSLPLLQEYATSVLPMTTIQVSVLLRISLEWMSILMLMLQTPIADHHNSRDKAFDREDGSQLLALDAVVNLVTQLATNQKPAYVARVCGVRSSNDDHTCVRPSSQQSGVDEHLEGYAANTYSRPPQQQRQGNS
ncbi:hypothetical protein Fmac_028631 [Flemingia macrophylla]|uniref:Uncharacterized protein n=1 Tax=Flemingia macrophylla TaxID=520843 RepID=A0ABD1L816_9FABA